MSEPLLEDDIEEELNSLTENTRELNSNFNELKNQKEEMDNWSNRDIQSAADELQNSIRQIEGLIAAVKESCKKLENINTGNGGLRTKAEKNRSTAQSSCTKIEKEFRDVKTFIMNKVRSVKSNPLENGPSHQDREDSDMVMNLKVVNLQSNKEALEQRGQQIDDLKVISGQINALTQEMKVKVDQDQEKFDTIENNVNEAKHNALKAEQNIDDANQMTKKNKTKLFCILGIVFLLVLGGIATLIVLMVKD